MPYQQQGWWRPRRTGWRSVTGAGAGLGRAIAGRARRRGREGRRVRFRRRVRARRRRRSPPASSGRSTSATAAQVDEAVRLLAAVDILVNNAGASTSARSCTRMTDHERHCSLDVMQDTPPSTACGPGAGHVERGKGSNREHRVPSARRAYPPTASASRTARPGPRCRRRPAARRPTGPTAGCASTASRPASSARRCGTPTSRPRVVDGDLLLAACSLAARRPSPARSATSAVFLCSDHGFSTRAARDVRDRQLARHHLRAGLSPFDPPESTRDAVRRAAGTETPDPAAPHRDPHSRPPHRSRGGRPADPGAARAERRPVRRSRSPHARRRVVGIDPESAWQIPVRMPGA